MTKQNINYNEAEVLDLSTDNIKMCNGFKYLGVIFFKYFKLEIEQDTHVFERYVKDVGTTSTTKM